MGGRLRTRFFSFENKSFQMKIYQWGFGAIIFSNENVWVKSV
jgi:hypothetical protein